MFEFLRKSEPSTGVVRFRGNIHPRAEEFSVQLDRAGVRHRIEAGNAGCHWRIKCVHDRWGKADIIAPRGAPAFPTQAVEFAIDLTEQERADASAPGVEIMLGVESKAKDVLRDRKSLLRYMRVLLGTDGLVAYDSGSGRCWSRAGLDEELSHDAELDIESLFVIHAVTAEEEFERAKQASKAAEGSDAPVPRPKPHWVHTHGLDNLGCFDMDILDPSPAISDQCPEILRALAFSILEGAAKEGGDAITLGGEMVRMIPARTFHVSASENDQSLRELDENHSEKRVVLCDLPATGLRAMFGSKALRPSTFLRKSKAEEGMIPFTNMATDLMTRRAKDTVEVFARLADEHAKFYFPRMIKAGYDTDDGGGREHMWFEVQEIRGSVIRAELAVQPYGVKSMSQGKVYDVPVERLSDWMIQSPFGSMTPRNLRAARILRENPDLAAQLLEILNMRPPDPRGR